MEDTINWKERAERAERERDELKERLDECVACNVHIQAEKIVKDAEAAREVAALRARVAELEAAMPSEDVRNLLRSAHCDDGGDSGYPGEVIAWLTRLDAALKSKEVV